MKKYLITLAAFVFLFACNSGDSGGEKTAEKKSTDTTENKPTTETNDLSNNPVYIKGLELESKSDCPTCHKVEEKLQGPSYKEIANKYADLPDTIYGHLANKIITGGTGVWGQIVMTPHPALSKEDADAMVKYIFLFKK